MSYPKLTPIIAKGATEPRYLEDRFTDVVNVKDFGAKGDGTTDDTVALQSALNSGRPVRMDGSFLVSNLTFPQNSKVYGDFTLVETGSFEPEEETDFDFNILSGCYIESLKIQIHSSDTFRRCVIVRSNTTIGHVHIFASVPVNGQALSLSGENIHVGNIEVEKIYRGIYISSADVSSIAKNIHIGTYVVKYCLQGLKLEFASHCSVGKGFISCFPDEFSYTPKPGTNGILLGGVDNILIDDVIIDHALEHAVRLGGLGTTTYEDSLLGRNSHDIHFGDITAIKHGGSALKLNSGYYERSYNIFANNIISIDAGVRERTVTRRLSTLRVSFCDSFDCNSVISRYTDPTNFLEFEDALETDVVEIDDSSNITISSLTADICGRSMICFHEGNDGGTSPFTGEKCENIEVHNIICKNSVANNTFYLVQFYCSGMEVNAVTLRNIYVFGVGFGGYLHNVNNDKVSNVSLQIYDRGTSGPNNNIAGVSTAQVFAARASGVNCLARSVLFDPSTAAPSSTLFLLGGQDSDGAAGCASALVFARRMSGKAGAAIASYQDVASQHACSLAFFLCNNTASSAAVYETWHMSASAITPAQDNAKNIGSASMRLAHVYASTGTVETSDERTKQNIEEPSDALFRAWGKVNFKIFKFKDSVLEKGENNARLHVGVIAQEIQSAFETENLDASQYGLFCYDEWPEHYEEKIIIDIPEQIDKNDKVIVKEESHTEKILIPAGNRFGVRYEEALALECAYQRWRLEQLEERINQLTNSNK